MSFSEPFSILGVNSADATVGDVKKAYASKLKQLKRDGDQQAFLNLRQAYEAAREQLNWRSFQTEFEPENDAVHLNRDRGSDHEAISCDELTEHISSSSDVNDVPSEPPPKFSSAVDEAMLAIEHLATKPWQSQDISAWQGIIDGEAIQSIDDFQEFEARFRNFFCTVTGFPDGIAPRRRRWMTTELLQFLDTRFGWSKIRSQNYWERRQNDWLYDLVGNSRYPIPKPPAIRAESRSFIDQIRMQWYVILLLFLLLILYLASLY